MTDLFFSKIPKSVNEILFLIGIFGFIFVLKNKRNKACMRFLLVATITMFTWRFLYRIDSSRYASGLIIFFSLFSAFFLKKTLFRNGTSLFISIIIISLWLLSWGLKNYNINSNNTNLKILAEVHERENRKNKRSLMYITEEEYFRIKQLEKGRYMLEAYSNTTTDSDLHSYANNYIKAGITSFFDMIVKSSDKPEKKTSLPNNCKQVVSFFSQKNKKKRHLVFKVQSDTTVYVVSNNTILEPDSGLLSNGDFETIDSLEDSYKKLKSHITNYSSFFSLSDARHTPYNAYFYNDPLYTKSLPYYNCTDINSISGKYSAIIDIKQGYGYLVFYQKIKGGKFQYSALLRAAKGTQICFLYKTSKSDQQNRLVPLTHFIVPDGRIYSISKSFEVNDLDDQDYFTFMLWVKGMAVLDNIIIKPVEERSTNSTF